MKKQSWILTGTLMLMLFCTISLSAQYQHNSNYNYDDGVVVTTYDGSQHYTNNGRRNKRSKRQIQNDRRWKANILDRAYAIALADGHIGRRERRELRKLENDLGIYRKSKRRRH